MIYARIRDLREDHDLNQTQVANVLGTTQTQYSRWERGAQEIPLHHFITLAKYYKVSLDYLAGLTNRKKDQLENLNSNPAYCLDHKETQKSPE